MAAAVLANTLGTAAMASISARTPIQCRFISSPNSALLGSRHTACRAAVQQEARQDRPDLRVGSSATENYNGRQGQVIVWQASAAGSITGGQSATSKDQPIVGPAAASRGRRGLLLASPHIPRSAAT